jgi:hypothetical protein
MTPYKLKILNGVLKLKSFADVVLNIFGIKDLGTQTGNVSNGLVDWSIQHLTKTTAQWNADTTTILLKGQLGIEDTGNASYKVKIGNGTNLWSALSYVGGGAGGSQDLQSVTDLGATTTNAINTAGVTSDYLQIDTTATPTNAIGKLVWNDSLGTAEIGLKGGTINAKLAQDLYARVVNKTNQNLLRSNYQAVKVQTAQGQRLAVNFAQANNDLNSADTIGIVAENINNNQEGFVITVGQITGLDTTGTLQGETWTDGDVLYLSPTTAGSLTNVKPNGSNGHIVVIGYVEYSHQNNGKIYVKIMNGWELDELHNVFISSPTNNQILTYESSTYLWKNKSVATALGYTPENSANKGVANGYAPLANDGKVDAAYLPAYVDEVLEYANLAAFPVTGASDKIYIALDTNKVYRWSGSIYIEVAANSGVWGAITGTITNQTDLVNYVTSRGYTLSMNCTSAFNPADNQIYFIGALQANPFSNDTNLRLIVPKTGTIKSVVFSSRQALGSGESSTIALSVNGSYVNISTSILFNSTNNTALITGLSRSVNAGDYVTIRWTTPTWATNPTNVFINCIIYIE